MILQTGYQSSGEGRTKGNETSISRVPSKLNEAKRSEAAQREPPLQLIELHSAKPRPPKKAHEGRHRCTSNTPKGLDSKLTWCRAFMTGTTSVAYLKPATPVYSRSTRRMKPPSLKSRTTAKSPGIGRASNLRDAEQHASTCGSGRVHRAWLAPSTYLPGRLCEGVPHGSGHGQIQA